MLGYELKAQKHYHAWIKLMRICDSNTYTFSFIFCLLLLTSCWKGNSLEQEEALNNKSYQLGITEYPSGQINEMVDTLNGYYLKLTRSGTVQYAGKFRISPLYILNEDKLIDKYEGIVPDGLWYADTCNCNELNLIQFSDTIVIFLDSMTVGEMGTLFYNTQYIPKK